ncbi:hypothetical protein A2X44_01780 [candidate division CPR3 bacterium GWF2_35_18]|uniref:LytR/CpsA/Psr regulator C-terminal domain-containing protein n=1 Tax=candidate division CPR3 bacterium GW2011_GWF2_35_18 TaxID=1618350 RepID=A0A0G0E3M5_UNCC3|nr:MAG: hypothetical protein UR67_C0002G0040 [candidate division CPR3 bacterium GW2011_GWF2_35_18]KKP86109.1 MAG: hypothetical protein UR87_C0029G0006 [candidate division CPR3 bacterium GW2011_GWE2_35_7]OGB62729.1 MAG: hypothetical protein A2X44_01780 [candidate division CPR3 bacterium GWF2_35_18]OGB65755.1 MAG: hypothetical protein A2250_02040 [candidate division CPR3 bacterium RIFOXYA2_FULL_35_13]OGB79047.1 MAG: hypothetical protein A2296_02485 [candidate division CPR3 bacterium RIFOXYB2_FULL
MVTSRLKMIKKRKSFAKKIINPKPRYIEKRGYRKIGVTVERSRRKKRTFLISILLIILLPLLGLILWQGVRITKIMLKPFDLALGNFERNTTWKGKTQLNILFLVLSSLDKKTATVENIYLIEVDKENENLRILKIPNDIDVDVAKGMGEYRLDKVYALGAIQDKKENMTLFKDTIEKNFAIPIDRYIAVDSSFPQFIDDSINFNQKELNSSAVSDLLKNNKNILNGISGVFNILKLKEESQGYISTNLAASEFLLFGSTLGKIEGEKLSYREFSNDLYTETEEEDEKHKQLEQIKLDFFIQTNFYDYLVRQERLKIKIYNATNTPQIASKASRLISNMGAEVIDLSNHENEKVSIIQVSSDMANSETVKRVRDAFRATIKIVQIDPIERADLKLIIGENWSFRMEGTIGENE